mmetsp:Transcript_10831/g.16352  ORF Transcript_10831/g.16352 Transcript_10831/m.16352 type:complete len:408 (-) Transcript_10831:125-1348(-)
MTPPLLQTTAPSSSPSSSSSSAACNRLASLSLADNGNGNDDDNNNNNGNNNGRGAAVEVGSTNNNVKKGQGMTLEEEIAMLKQEKKKAPFHEYETGCRGAVFIMCTLEKSNLVPSPIPSSLCADEENNTVKRKIDDQGDKDTLNSSNPSNKKQKTEQAAQKIETKEAKNNDEGAIGDKDKDEEGDKEVTTQNTSTADETKWDPIQTVLSIIKGIKNDESAAPRSRFITKMIPIQATCFANMEEMQSTATSLIRKFLIPHGIQFYHNGSNSSTGESESKSNDQKKKPPTFKIEFRKRFCSHLKRDEVIEIIANAVQVLTNDFWDSNKKVGEISKDTSEVEQNASNSCKEEGQSKGDKNDDTQLFGVDLKNPDYTIIVEVCRTLCTMSVVKDAQSYHNFNLTKIQENIE